MLRWSSYRDWGILLYKPKVSAINLLRLFEMAEAGNKEWENVIWVKSMKMGHGAPHDFKTQKRLMKPFKESGRGTEKSPKV